MEYGKFSLFSIFYRIRLDFYAFVRNYYQTSRSNFLSFDLSSTISIAFSSGLRYESLSMLIILGARGN